VRFVQLFNGAYQTGGEGVSNWDGHKELFKEYSVHGPVLDKPTAGLLIDLKQRGLLGDTLVVWCTEFGRMPTFQKGAQGRDHNPNGFTCWMAGAGVKKGVSYGATDEFGYKSVENIVSVYDLHATVLHLLGLDHDAAHLLPQRLSSNVALTDVESRQKVVNLAAHNDIAHAERNRTGFSACPRCGSKRADGPAGRRALPGGKS
jgi:arylsulfatase A-like enzyme